MQATINALEVENALLYTGQRTNVPVLMDSFARRLTYLRFSVTDFCNFRCNYCLPNGYQGQRPKNELTLAEIAFLFEGFAQLGTQKIRLTGGEPTIRSDLIDIIALAKQQTGIETVAVSSNGYKLGKHIAGFRAAGLTQLNISIDSFDPFMFKQITGFDILPQLLKDIDALLDTTDIRLKINGILTASNGMDNLALVLDYIKHRPVTYRFIEFMQTSDNRQLFFTEHTRAVAMKHYLLMQGWQPLTRTSDAGPATEYAHPDYVGRIGIIEPYAAHFCESCNRLRVSSVGKVHLCLFDSSHYDLRPLLAAGDIAGLKDVLQGLMPIKPEHHLLTEHNSGLMTNLSLVGG